MRVIRYRHVWRGAFDRFLLALGCALGGCAGVMNAPSLERARRLLCGLQDEIQATLIAARVVEGRRFARVAEVVAEDTIFHVDKLSEAAILSWLEREWPRAWGVELVMEGLAPGTCFPRGLRPAEAEWVLILDPIDGTRCLMYDKRPAWALAGLAPRRGGRATLADIVVAAMTELPTAKAGFADQFSAVRGRGLVATRRELGTGKVKRWTPRPSQARDCDHGFASLVKFFPEGKALAAGVEEALWRELGLYLHEGGARVFDDQYISTGGQLYELLVGHDRMVADLRPLLLPRVGVPAGLCCHPYDICTALLLEAAGGVVETPEGKPLRARLDTTSPVAWVGYANGELARRMRPALKRALRAVGV